MGRPGGEGEGGHFEMGIEKQGVGECTGRVGEMVLETGENSYNWGS